MNPQINSLRVFGGAVNRIESYLTYNVVGTDIEGNIHLQNVADKSDEQKWETEKFRELFEEGLALNEANVPDDKAWDTLDKLTKNRTDNQYNNFADSYLEDAQRSIFRAMVEQSKD